MPRLAKVNPEDAQALCEAGLLWEEGVNSKAGFLRPVPRTLRLRDWSDSVERIGFTHPHYYIGILLEE